MSKQVVVIAINPIIGYLNGRGSSYVGDSESSILKSSLKDYLKGLDRGYTKVMMTREVRSPSDTYYSNRPSGFLVGSDDISILESFRRFADLIINTSRPDATHKTLLLSELKKISVDKVVIVGLELSSSILLTSISLRSHGYDVEVVEPLTLSRDNYLHSAAISIAASEGVSFVKH